MSDIIIPKFSDRKLQSRLRLNDIIYSGTREEVKIAWKQCQNHNIPSSMTAETPSTWRLTVPCVFAGHIAKLPAETRAEVNQEFIDNMAIEDEEIATY